MGKPIKDAQYLTEEDAIDLRSLKIDFDRYLIVEPLNDQNHLLRLFFDKARITNEIKTKIKAELKTKLKSSLGGQIVSSTPVKVNQEDSNDEVDEIH